MASLPASKEFPGFANVFTWEDPCTGKHYRGDLWLPTVAGDLAFAVLRGEWQPGSPVSVTHRMGRRVPSDVVWTSSAVPVIIGPRVVELLEGNGFTGWTTYPVTVRAKSGEAVPGYHGLAVTGRCGPIDVSRCRKVLRHYPAKTVEQAVGVYFDETSWDGSDLFCSNDGTGSVFCTAAVKRALERAKVRNLRLPCVEDVDNYRPPAPR